MTDDRLGDFGSHLSVRIALLSCLAIALACVAPRERGQASRDAGPALDASEERRMGDPIELALLEPWDPARPFNHSREVSIAASDGHVVVASINEHFASADSYDATGFHKRVGVNVSRDRGETYEEALDPGAGDQTTDPVVRAAVDGSFWFATWDTQNATDVLLRSIDRGDTWNIVVPDADYGDKEWIAVDDANGAVYTGAVAGLRKYSFDGTLSSSNTVYAGMMAGAYVDELGVHFGTAGFTVIRWDGSSAEQEGQALPAGPSGEMYTTVCWSLGRTPDGGQWIVRATRSGNLGAIVARVRRLPDEGIDIAVSRADAVAFLPAAAMDARGRLHVVWYDSARDAGVLEYARSLSDDVRDGFTDPMVIDPEATPGAGWYPSFDSESGARRLREYIDVAIDQDRLHIAWTHAPRPPSRVHAIWIDLGE